MTAATFTRAIAAIALLLCLAACAPSRTAVTFAVTGPDAQPERGARIRAIPLKISPAPLPLSPENLADARLAPGDARSTNEQGYATLRLAQDRPHFIEVLPNPLRGRDDPALGRWYLPDHNADPQIVDPSPAGLNLERRR